MEQSLKSAVLEIRQLFRAPPGESEEGLRDREIEKRVWIDSVIKQARGQKRGLNVLFSHIDRKQDRLILETIRDELRKELVALQAKMDVHLLLHPKFDGDLKLQMDEILSSDLWCSRTKQPLTVREGDREKVRKSLSGSCVIPRNDLKGHGFRHVDHPLSAIFYHAQR